MHANVARKHEAKINLTDVASLWPNEIIMARAGDVLKRIKAALVVDAARQKEIAEEMDKHAESYNRYLALQRQAREHEESAQAIMALLGPEGFGIAMNEDKSETIGTQVDIWPSPRYLRDNAALWEHISQYVRFAPDSQVNDIMSFLGWMGIKTSRQAIESAIRTHSRVFAVKKRGREKFISLKGT